MRFLTRAQRQGDAGAGARIEACCAELVSDLDGTLGVLKAFTTYFQLVNLAEEQQRVRVVRQRTARAEEEGLPMPETIAAAIERLRGGGTGRDEIDQLLQEMLIQPVFTAHPTEAKRRTILLKLLDLSTLLHDLEFRVLLSSERETIWEQVREIVVSLWQSDVNRERRPDVLDEVREGLYFFDTTLFDLLPEIYAELKKELEAAFPGETSGETVDRTARASAHLSTLRIMDRRRPRWEPVRHAECNRRRLAAAETAGARTLPANRRRHVRSSQRGAHTRRVCAGVSRRPRARPGDGARKRQGPVGTLLTRTVPPENDPDLQAPRRDDGAEQGELGLAEAGLLGLPQRG